jgi:hypothetical protein
MNLPLTAQDVENEIQISAAKASENGNQRLQQLITILAKVDSEIIVEGIIRVFERGQRSDLLDQEYAGRILEAINPLSNKALNEILNRTLKGWDKSIEQFPLWLKNNYGIETILATIAVLELSELEKDKLRTVKWWLKL